MTLNFKKITSFLLLFIISVFIGIIFVKANKYYIFTINNTSLDQIKRPNEPYKIWPTKSENPQEEIDKIVADFVTDNEYDIEENTAVKKKPSKKENILTENNIKLFNQVKTDKIEQPQNIMNQNSNLIQLGAFKNRENLLQNIKRLKENFPKLISNKSFFIDENQDLFKLLTGPFKTKNKAREFCAKLRQNGVSCFFVNL